MITTPIRDLYLPIPTQIVSNEEFVPIPQTREQRQVEAKLNEIADDASKKLGVSRRSFLASSGGMAAAFLAMNAVFGCRSFDVDPSEVMEPGATAEKWPKNEFIFDIQTHHVAAGRIIEMPPLLRYREFGAMMGNEALEGPHARLGRPLSRELREGDLPRQRHVVAVITGLPSRTEDQNVLPAADMVETRAQVNGLAQSKRLIAHGLFSPDLGSANMEEMQRQVEQLKIEAWKGYPGQPLAPDGKRVVDGRREGRVSGVRVLAPRRHQEHLRAQGAAAAGAGTWSTAARATCRRRRSIFPTSIS